jgi:uncharacterized protein (TIRG00374 family)
VVKNSLSFFLSLWSSKIFRYSVGALVSLLALYLALRDVDFGEVGRAIRIADYRLVGLALASVAVNQLARAFRWRVLLGSGQSGVHLGGDNRPAAVSPGYSLFDLLVVLLSAQLLNTVYPARVGDLSRAYVIGGKGPGRVFTLGTILLEKLLDTLAYGGLFLVVLFSLSLPAWVRSSVSTLALAAVLAALIAALLAYRPAALLGLADKIFARFPGSLARFMQPHLKDGIDSLHTLRSRSDLARLVFWTAVIWATAVLNNALALRAMQLSLPWMAPIFVLVVLQIGISLPSTPGSIGIFEYGCILALSLFAVERAAALSFGFVLHAVVFLPVVFFGFLAFLYLGLNAGEVAQFRQVSEGQKRTRTSADERGKMEGEEPSAINRPQT